MEIILQERVNNLGKIGDVVTVKAGYARNFLLPYGKAMVATVANKAIIEEKRGSLEAKEAEQLAEAQKRADALAAVGGIELVVRASDEGKLYGSVGSADISAALAEKGQSITKADILLVESIRELGVHSVSIRFHLDLVAPLQVTVSSDNEEYNAMQRELMDASETEAVDEFSFDEDQFGE